MGITGPLWKWLQSYLNLYYTSIDGEASGLLPVTSGILLLIFQTVSSQMYICIYFRWWYEVSQNNPFFRITIWP